MNSYRRSVMFEGDPARILTAAREFFLQHGYRITDSIGNRVSARHEGGFVMSHSRTPIYGASPISLSVRLGELTIEAGFEGVEKARRFAVRLVSGLALFLGVVLTVVFALVFKDSTPVVMGAVFGVGVPLVQLPVHYYLTPVIMRKRAVQALDTLGDNLRQLG